MAAGSPPMEKSWSGRSTLTLPPERIWVRSTRTGASMLMSPLPVCTVSSVSEPRRFSTGPAMVISGQG